MHNLHTVRAIGLTVLQQAYLARKQQRGVRVRVRRTALGKNIVQRYVSNDGYYWLNPRWENVNNWDMRETVGLDGWATTPKLPKRIHELADQLDITKVVVMQSKSVK